MWLTNLGRQLLFACSGELNGLTRLKIGLGLAYSMERVSHYTNVLSGFNLIIL